MLKLSKSTVPGKGHQIVFWAISSLGCFFDLWSKQAVFDWLLDKPGYEHVFVEGFLRFVLRQNAGAAFSMLHGKRIFLVAISAIAFIFLIWVFYSGSAKGWYMTVLQGMFLAGVTGNFYDRVFNDGLVRDFIDVYIKPFDYHWPTFNVADSLLCVSLGLFMVHLIMSEFKKPS